MVMTKVMMMVTRGWTLSVWGAVLVVATQWISSMPAAAGDDLLTGTPSVQQLKADAIRYQEMGFNQLAVEAYRNAIDFEDRTKVLPSQRDPDVPFNLGLIYLNQGQLQAARDVFARAVEADPENFKARYQLGMTELRLGNEEEAQAELELLLQASVNNPEMEAHLNMVLDELPSKQKATETARLSTADEPTEVAAPNSAPEDVAGGSPESPATVATDETILTAEEATSSPSEEAADPSQAPVILDRQRD